MVYAVGAKGAITPTVTFRLFNENGEWEDINLAEKVSLNGRSGVFAQAVASEMKCSKNGDFSIISYLTNANGEIKVLETPKMFADIDEASYNSVKGEFNGIANVSEKYRTGNSSFDSEVFIKDDAKIWFVDVDCPEKIESYRVGSKNLIRNDEDCTVNAYNIDEGMQAELFIIMQNTSSVSTSLQTAEMFVVDEVSKIMSENGTPISRLTGKMGVYEQFSYNCEDESVISDIKKGDAISLHTDAGGYIDSVVKYYDFGNAGDANLYEDPATIHALGNIVKGKVVKVNTQDAWIKIDCKGKKPRIVRTNNIKTVVIYDTETDKISNGKLGDVEEGAEAVIKLNYSTAKAMVVYQ